MAISLSSVVGFYISSRGKNGPMSRSSVRASTPKIAQFRQSLGVFGSKVQTKERRMVVNLSVADSDDLATDASDKGPEGAGTVISDNPLSAVDTSSMDALGENSQLQNSVSEDSGPQTSGSSNGSTVSSHQKQARISKLQSLPKKSPLTARERLKAARVLNRYNESKVSKSEMGSKVLDALRESDRGKKRSGLPEAPTNMFDDSKRGLPKQGLTFDFPGGADLFVIVLSVVTISTIMFATTYIVWKAGAIHFNEY